MKKLNNIEELDQLFKEELNKLQTPPPADVWTSVASSAAGQSASVFSQLSTYLSSVTNLVKLALFVGGIGTVGVLLYNANKEPVKLEAETTQEDQLAGVDETTAESLTDTETETTPVENRVLNQSNVVNSSEASSNSDYQSGLEDAGISNPSEILIDDNLEQPDMPIVEDPTEIQTPLEIRSISAVCCLGETRTFSSGNVKGNWFLNGNLVKSNSEVFSHRFMSGGKQSIVFKAKERQTKFALEVQTTEASISIEDLGNGQHQVSLISDAKAVRWLVNGQLMSTNEVFNPILKVGKNHIAVEAKFGECTLIKEKIIEVKGRGHFAVKYDFISPNGDGENETYPIDIKHYTKFYIQIFDKNSNRVFESADPDVEWNGTVANVGANCPAGIYTVKITYQLEGEEIKTELFKLTLTR